MVGCMHYLYDAALWRNNRISDDSEYFYHHDDHGRLTGRDERLIRDGGSHCHRYHYDHQHRLVQYARTQQDRTLTTVARSWHSSALTEK